MTEYLTKFALTLLAAALPAAQTASAESKQPLDTKITTSTPSPLNRDQLQRMDAFIQKAESLESRSAYAEAVVVLNKALAISPQYAPLYAKRGDAYERLLDFSKAAQDFTKAISLDPKRDSLYRHRASVYYKANKFSQALSDFNTAAQLDPDEASVYRMRGKVHQQLGHSKEAIADYSKYFDLGGNDPNGDYRNALAKLCLETGQMDRALKMYSKTIMLVPDLPAAYYGRAECYEKMGKHSLARQDRKRGKELELDF